MTGLKDVINSISLGILIFLMIGFVMEICAELTNEKTEVWMFHVLFISAFTYSSTRK